jgi:SHS2 domain-containing protein
VETGLDPIRWEHFAHGADVGVRGVGPTLEQAFEQAAIALTAAIADPKSIHPVISVPIACDAPDAELLLVEWLNAVVYEMSTRRMLFGRFEVQVHGSGLQALAHGEPVDRERHEPAVEVKGATYTSLLVVRRDDGAWIAQCVVDV